MFNRSHEILRTVLGLHLAFAASALTLHAQGTPTFADVTVHDPSVIRDGSNYYVFGSHLASASTTDLMHWTQITADWNATTNPTCVLIRGDSPQTEFAEALNYTVPPAFWGPDVRKLGDGRYYLYYCVCNGTSRAALGLAVANSITGPYANVGIMLESGMSGVSPDGTVYNNAVHPNVVDPSVFSDNSGHLWMVYGSYSGGIFILSLDPATGQPVAGQAYGKKLIGGNNCRIEGPFILYSPETAYYYLFCTFGGFDISGGYNIRVGRSRNPDGPYLDAAGNDLTNVKGAPNTVFDDSSIAPYGVKLMGNCQFLHVASEPLATSVGYISPGGTSATYDSATGKYLLIFHTRFVGQGETHHVRVHQMFLNADGWFVVAPHRYAQETMTTTIASQIPGDFKLINHGKDITATVKTSSIVTLQADGTVTGAATGTWQLTGDHFANLMFAGTAYHGVFSRQWDDDNQAWTLTFSALSADGVSVWGTKIIPGNQLSQVVTAGHVVSLVASATTSTWFQWQIFPSGGQGWQNLSNDNTYGGVGTPLLTITNAASALDGAKYRYVTPIETGVPVTLTVSPSLLAAPVGVAVDASDNLYVADNTNNTIARITATGAFSILAGSTGTLGSTDGTGGTALFRAPTGLALDNSGNLYVADTGNSTVRKITATGVVTTLAGSSGTSGSANGAGTAARFASPADLTSASSGTLFVADTGNHTVRVIDSAGNVTTLAGTAGASGTSDGSGSTARFNGLAGIAVNSAGDIYVADTVNNTLRKVTSAGVVTTLAGTFGVTGSTDATGVNALFSGLTGTAVDGAGNIVVADTQNSTIRRISPAGVVTTVAGLPGVAGLKDGAGNAAWFNKPRDAAVDSTGNIFVADTGNAAVRKIDANGNVTTLALAAGSAPIFTTQPAGQTVTTGSSVTFTVAASGLPAPGFQWQKGGVNISGATNVSFSISSATATDAGSYTVVATNAAGSVTSNAATLTVNAAPAPTPTPSGGGGGGGGAMEAWFVAGLMLLGAIRWPVRKDKTAV